MKMLFISMIGVKPIMEFPYWSNLKKSCSFILDHPNIRILIGNLLRFIGLLLYYSIKVDLNDYQIELKISLKDN